MRGRHLPPGIANAVPSLQVVCTSRRRRAKGSCSHQSTLDLNPLFRDSELADSASRFFSDPFDCVHLIGNRRKVPKSSSVFGTIFHSRIFFFLLHLLRGQVSNQVSGCSSSRDYSCGSACALRALGLRSWKGGWSRRFAGMRMLGHFLLRGGLWGS